MVMFKNKEESNESKEGSMPRQASVLSQQSSKKQEESLMSLFRGNTDKAENYGSTSTRNKGWKNSTKGEKISIGIGLAGIASVLGAEALSVSAAATGALSTAAIAAYSGAMIAGGLVGMVIGAAGLYASMIHGKLSKRKAGEKVSGT